MKNLIGLVVAVVLACSLLYGGDTSTVVGKWDCEALVDMTYPFELEIVEKDGGLTGTSSSDMGTSELSNTSYANGTLKFEMDIPEAGGIIYYDAKVDGKTLTGTLGNDMFEGDLMCKRPE